MRFRFYIASCAALFLASCGELPRPFQPDVKSPAKGLLRPIDSAGVVVQPVAGIPDAAARQAAEKIAEALRRKDVPASTRGSNPASLILASEVITTGDPALRLILREPGGTLIGQHTARFAPTARSPDDDAAWTELARESATALAAQLQPRAAVLAPPPPSIFIGQVNGAPGDGGRALSRALDYALRRAGAKLVEASEPDSVVVLGEVTISPKGAQMRGVDVRWIVLAPDGNELGQIRQENDVPAQMLERAWAEMAVAVAEGAAEGIIDLLDHVPRRKL